MPGTTSVVVPRMTIRAISAGVAPRAMARRRSPRRRPGGIVAAVAAAASAALRSGADPQPGNITPDPPPITRMPIVRLHF